MPVLKIYKYPDPVLRKNCRKVEKVGARERKILSQMVETMYVYEGVGLAAPQVGIDFQMVVAGVGGELYKLVNPLIIYQEGESKMEEGCLSLPGVTVKIKRAKKILVEALNERGEPVKIEAEDLLAHVLQHEIDHLQGTLIIDYLSQRELKKISPKLKDLEEEFQKSEDYVSGRQVLKDNDKTLYRR